MGIGKTPESKPGIEHISQLILDPEVKNVIIEMQKRILTSLGINEQLSDELTWICVQLAEVCDDIFEYEKLAYYALKRDHALDWLQFKLLERAQTICGQIKPYLLFPGSTLDYGCGDAKIGILLSRLGFDVSLTDVNIAPNVPICNLPFNQIKEGEKIPYENDQFVNTLLLTVLHHCENPDLVIQEACRVTQNGGRIIVIESVVDPGVTADHPFFTLNPEQQRQLNIYFDHLYNRIMHYSPNSDEKVNIPCNFDSPDNWKTRIERAGCRQLKCIHLGFDQPVVPEYHTLHVFEVKKPTI